VVLVSRKHHDVYRFVDDHGEHSWDFGKNFLSKDDLQTICYFLLVLPERKVTPQFGYDKLSGFLVWETAEKRLLLAFRQGEIFVNEHLAGRDHGHYDHVAFSGWKGETIPDSILCLIPEDE
jgi:hypothetical protein